MMSEVCMSPNGNNSDVSCVGVIRGVASGWRPCWLDQSGCSTSYPTSLVRGNVTQYSENDEC